MKATRNDACEACLAAVLLFGTAALEILLDEGLRPDDFWRREHRATFAAAVHLHDHDQPVDALTVKSRLEDTIAAGDTTWTDPVQARATVDQLATAVSDLAALRGYATIVRTEAAWDQRGRALTDAADAIHRRDDDAFTAALARIDAANGTARDTTHTPEQLADEFVTWLENPDQHVIPTGLQPLDQVLAGGLRRGDTTVIGAWTSQGKSVLVDQILHHAGDQGATAAVYLNEMDRMDRTARTVARMTTIPYERLIARELNKQDWATVLNGMSSLPFAIIECAGWSAAEIARHIRRNRWNIAAVDLVTRIPARDTADWDDISGTLTNVARQTGTHLLMVCQLNQERNKSPIKPPPVLRDLRGTGAWGNDAANVLFLHRDQEMIAGTDMARTLEDGLIRAEKCRHGKPGEVVQITFNAARMCLEALNDYRQPLEAAA